MCSYLSLYFSWYAPAANSSERCDGLRNILLATVPKHQRSTTTVDGCYVQEDCDDDTIVVGRPVVELGWSV